MLEAAVADALGAGYLASYYADVYVRGADSNTTRARPARFRARRFARSFPAGRVRRRKSRCPALVRCSGTTASAALRTWAARRSRPRSAWALRSSRRSSRPSAAVRNRRRRMEWCAHQLAGETLAVRPIYTYDDYGALYIIYILSSSGRTVLAVSVTLRVRIADRLLRQPATASCADASTDAALAEERAIPIDRIIDIGGRRYPCRHAMDMHTT